MKKQSINQQMALVGKWLPAWLCFLELGIPASHKMLAAFAADLEGVVGIFRVCL